jgi:RNA polymerase sigma factor (sigma-70 family)
MNESAARVDVETLLEHREFLRRLLRRLIGDESRVEDILQETWIAALDRTDLRREGLRGWLVTVSRNLARKALRSDSRRRVRERAAAQPEGVDLPSSDPVEQMAWHKRVVEEVLDLPEPYRTAVLRRFLREEEPALIGSDQGIPAATVRTRVHRGLALLRQRLDARADRRTWLGALLPLILPRPRTVSPGPALLATGVLLMTTKGKIATAAIVLALLAPLAGLGVFLASGSGDEAPHAALERSPTADASPPEAAVEKTDGDDSDQTSNRSPEEEPGVLVRGRVVDAEGRPIPGAEIGAATLEMGMIPRDEQKVVSDEKGEFEVRVKPGEDVRLEGSKEGFGLTRVVEKSTPALADEPVEIVLQAASRIQGIVLGPDGRPVAGARVAWQRIGRPDPSEPLTRITTAADGFWDRTDEDGRFEVRVSPASIRKLTLYASREGFAPGHVTLSGRRLASPGKITLVLGITRPVEVHVVDAASGRPVADAEVWVTTVLGENFRQTNMGRGGRLSQMRRTGEGCWTVTGLAIDATIGVQAQAIGYTTWREKALKVGDEPVIVRLVAREVVRLSGRILSARGRPVPNATVHAYEQVPADVRMDSATVYADARGRYEFPDLKRGSRYRIEALTRDYSRVAFPQDVVANGYGTLDLVMTAVCRIRGRLVSTASDVDIRSAVLWTDRVRDLTTGKERTPTQGGPVIERSHGGIGRFAAGHWPEGIYDFTLRPRGHLPVVIRDVRLEKGRVTDLGVITCERANGLTVVARGPDGIPVEGCRIVAMGGPDVIRISGRAGEDDGMSICVRLPDGDYRLFAIGAGIATSFLGSVRLEGEVDRRVTSPLSPGCGMTIEIRDAEGEPVPGVALDVRAAAEPPLDRILVAGLRKNVWWWTCRDRSLPVWADLETVTDDDGLLTLGPLQPGPYVISVGDERRKVDILSGETTVVRIRR